MNVVTRTPETSTAPKASSTALSPLMQGVPGGKAKLPRSVWIAGGLMGFTIIALAAVLVMKSTGDSTPAAAADPGAQATALMAPDQGASANGAALATANQAAPHGSTAHHSSTAAKGNTAESGSDAPAPPQQVAAAPVCTTCGVIESYNAVQLQGQTNGVGAVAGGVGGAVLGSKIAGRNNHTVGGIVGAIGGGLLGNAVEKHYRTYTAYDVNVRMNDGSLRTVRQSSVPSVGEHVTVDGKTLHPASASAS